jgi:hypothetical protein
MATVLHGYLTGYRSTVASLLGRIRELESRDYPTPLSRSLLKVLKGAVEESALLVEEKHRSSAADLETAITRHSALLVHLHELVHLVSRSVGADVPRWAIEPMKAEVAKYLSGSADIMMVGSDEGGNFAYDYRLDGLRGLLSRALGTKLADQLMGDLPEHMAVFHFPFGERDNVIAHGAFFHEVAHQIDIGIRGISERVTTAFLTSNDTAIRDTVRDQSKRFLGVEEEGDQRSIEEEQVELLIEEHVKAVQSVLWYWAREFCADSIATRILGPAYAVIVVVSPSLLSMLNAHAPTHPCTLLRLRTILDLLSNEHAGDFLNTARGSLHTAGILELLDEWRARTDTVDTSSLKWVLPVHSLAGPELAPATARWGAELAREIVRAVVEETSEQGYYTPSTFENDIHEVMPTLRQWVTINERIDYRSRTHVVNDIATIYNVGVACYLAETTFEGRARLSNLLRKSIELSQIQRSVLNPSSAGSE